ncbi:hypothetical protein P2G88_06875 [Aliiglaciecola sp. CAU 1673]|uniref:PKD domain-containing protein n=1 Tax=Aliiglaciecola sp. CAU 1673 TaxID=3032595 RepID=UPI0023DC0426|nr:choice-of-anchor X domain-containing protein [Aliiglaciecola sp. CAU 1673]MDF2177971.1 hypothetical protein [Aliiglaciecola sp. CAU 1673]
MASAGEAQTVTENTEVQLSGSGTDSDGAISVYLWQQVDGIAVSISNADQPVATFKAPPALEPLTLTFELKVTDDFGDSHTDITVVRVTPYQSLTWEPSSNTRCTHDQNISPVAPNVANVLTNVGERMFEPSIIFSDQTFTWYSRHEAGPASMELETLQYGGFLSVDGEEPKTAYDDGTHGDQTPGDGIFTRACLYVGEDFLAGKDFREASNLWIISNTFRGTDSAVELTPNVRANDSGFFIALGAQYDIRYQSNWLLHSPEFCGACEIAWQLAGDVFDFFAVTPRDPVGGAGYVRVHDNIEGTGFTPPCANNAYCYPIIDGNEHQKLSGIIWSGWPGIEAMNHELGHGLLGVGAKDFPAAGTGAWNSGDGMHHDADITVNGELSGPFWDPDRGWPHSVLLVDSLGQRSETYLIRDEQGQFRLRKMDDQFKVWDDILLYMMGLLTKEQVTKTYYKLVNPELTGCVSEELHLVCTNDLVTAEQIIPFTIDDFTARFGTWTAPDFYQPTALTLGVLNISDRPHTNAEIVWFSRVYREFAVETPSSTSWSTGTAWSKATRGLSNIRINALEMTQR